MSWSTCLMMDNYRKLKFQHFHCMRLVSISSQSYLENERRDRRLQHGLRVRATADVRIETIYLCAHRLAAFSCHNMARIHEGVDDGCLINDSKPMVEHRAELALVEVAEPTVVDEGHHLWLSNELKLFELDRNGKG